MEQANQRADSSTVSEYKAQRFGSQVREVINRNALVSLALGMGYNAFLPVYDGGVDFILYNETTGDTKKVQLKGRWTIDRKYVGRDIWIAFHDNGDWYLAPHDEMVRLAEGYGYTASPSWTLRAGYNCGRLSRQMQIDMAPYRFGYVSDIERGARNPKVTVVEKLAKPLGVRPGALLD